MDEGGNRKMLHQTGKIGEPEVDHFDPLFRGELDHFCGAALLHLFLPTQGRVGAASTPV
jgi:hypothetical protein